MVRDSYPTRPLGQTRFESVTSTNVAAVGYDPGMGRRAVPCLWVRFLSGGTYGYEGVPESTHKALMGAASKGSFHYWIVRNGGKTSRYRTVVPG